MRIILSMAEAGSRTLVAIVKVFQGSQRAFTHRSWASILQGRSIVDEGERTEGTMQFQQRWSRREICTYQIDAMELQRVPHDG